MLQQAEEDHQHWGSGITGGNGGWGSTKAATDDRGFSLEGGALRNGGFVDPLMVSSGFGADLTSNLLRLPVQQNSLSVPFSWQSLLSGQANARWQLDNTSFPGFATESRVDHAKSLNVFALGEENVRRDGEHESTSGDGEGGPAKEDWANNVKSAKGNWRIPGGMCLLWIFSTSRIKPEIILPSLICINRNICSHDFCGFCLGTLDFCVLSILGSMKLS